MSLSTLPVISPGAGSVANALSQRFAARLARQYNRMAVLGAALPSESGFGKNIAWDVETDGQLAASYAEGADVGAGEFTVDTLLPATLNWGLYRSAFQVSETEFDAAASSAGSADALINLFRERVESAVTKLASVLNVDFWSGTGTDGSGNPTIVGVTGGSLEATGIYAGISRSSYPLWAGNVLANGGVARPLSVDLMEQMDQNIFVASGLRANLIAVSAGVWRKYKGLFEAIRRVEGQGPLQRYDTSVSEISFQGIPIVRDKDAPESGGKGTMAFINTDHMKKVYLPFSGQSAQDAWKLVEQMGEGSNGEAERNNLMLPFRIVPLAKTGDSLKFMVRAQVGLKVDRPNSQGYITDIAV